MMIGNPRPPERILTQEAMRLRLPWGVKKHRQGLDISFDIVITDVRMEDKDGMEVLRAFKTVS